MSPAVPRFRKIQGILHASPGQSADFAPASSPHLSKIPMATDTFPAGWSLLAARPREELHQALLTSTCERSFGDVPVDWWDGSAEVWRPTSIVRLLGGVWDVARDVEVLVPDAGGASVSRVSIAHVRLSRLLTAGVSRYWVARYQKLLVLRLIEQATVLGGEPDPLRRLAARMRHQEALGRDVWATAYLTGARDGVEYAPEVAPATDDNGWEPADARDSAAIIHAAVRVLAADLLRLDAALEEAGAIRRRTGGASTPRCDHFASAALPGDADGQPSGIRFSPGLSSTRTAASSRHSSRTRSQSRSPSISNPGARLREHGDHLRVDRPDAVKIGDPAPRDRTPARARASGASTPPSARAASARRAASRAEAPSPPMCELAGSAMWSESARSWTRPVTTSRARTARIVRRHGHPERSQPQSGAEARIDDDPPGHRVGGRSPDGRQPGVRARAGSPGRARSPRPTTAWHDTPGRRGLQRAGSARRRMPSSSVAARAPSPVARRRIDGATDGVGGNPREAKTPAVALGAPAGGSDAWRRPRVTPDHAKRRPVDLDANGCCRVVPLRVDRELNEHQSGDLRTRAPDGPAPALVSTVKPVRAVIPARARSMTSSVRAPAAGLAPGDEPQRAAEHANALRLRARSTYARHSRWLSSNRRQQLIAVR